MFFLALIIGGLNIELQSGGIFNYGEIAINCARSNIHQEADANSFCVGDGSFFYGTTDQPSVSVNGVITDIIDGDAAKTVKEFAGF
ncbi:hypothetical protein [Pelotomaculum propionicicum]|uniref:hypothetical protein n=1 Tax=Pelotomaculum propionicicum TaxID=258475 RepID=UPI0010671857|nr:hypothetical protein [Pelotomaculum propionicicum]NLI12893.1 hypothetical protein [Peptococcaceae bacterium]